MRAIGLMSGTSMDGVDAALLETDGETVTARAGGVSRPYPPDFRRRLSDVLGREDAPAELVATLTDFHADAVTNLLKKTGESSGKIDVIGFHGHTLTHLPEREKTVQIGDGRRLAAATGIDVVADFRSSDVCAGGQGAPLVPVYHRALMAGMEKPVAVLNIGGIANVTWIGPKGRLLAFDTGPGNARLDDLVQARAGLPMDENGRIAASASADSSLIARWLEDPWFKKAPPKSLDRTAFESWGRDVADLSLPRAAATLVAGTAAAVAAGAEHFPAPPVRWVVAGGGARNPVMMAALRDRLEAPVDLATEAGLDGDLLEAEAFAFLAVRHLKGLSLTFPGTTGVPRPQTGGRFFSA